MADTKKPDATPDAFGEFLKQSENFLDSVIDGITRAIGDHDDAPLVASHCGALREQFLKLTQLTRERYAGATPDARRVVDDFMSAQSVTTLARNGQGAFQKNIAGGVVTEGLFSWIESIAEEIKKIINMIWELFGKVPDWLTKLEQIIDQILKLVLGLFGGASGGSRSRIMSDLSAMETEYWNELAAHKRYILAASGATVEHED